MRDLNPLSAKTILQNRLPESLFSKERAALKKEFRFLIKKWHPDRNRDPLAKKVVDHIVTLQREALVKLKENTWLEPFEKLEVQIPGQKRIALEDGGVKKYTYYESHSFELGNFYIDDHYLLFEVDTRFDDLFRNGRRQIRALPYQDREMAAEFSRYVPEIYETFKSKEADYMLVRKTPDQILLKDLLNYRGEKLEGEHVAWILNNLYNLVTYFSFAGITHNAINPNTLFISPLRHSIMLLGGWWYAVPGGERMIALPAETLEYIDHKVLAEKLASHKTDLNLIKGLGASLLDVEDSSYPILSPWLSKPAASSDPLSVLQEYGRWKYEVLEKAFGEATFVEMSVTKEEIYKN